MAVRLEHSGNAAGTTITTSITNASTTINIASASGWPTGSVGPFVVTLDAGTASEEKVLVLSRTGTSLTVSARGYDGTTATSHANGAAITHTFSATEADEANALAAQATAGGGMATLTGTQTMTNKTLTSPVLNSPTNNGGSFDSPIGRRNVLRNGDTGVIQRGAAAFTAAAVTTADGWIKDHAGGTHSVTPTSAEIGTGMGGNGAPLYLRSVVGTQAAATDYALLMQRIEYVRTLAGSTVTLSFIARASAGTPKIGVEIEQNFGTGGAPSAAVRTAISAVTLSTTATRYSVSFTVPSISGKTVGTAGNDYLQLGLWLSAGANNAARASSIGIQNVTIDITDVQLEQGGLTAFERLDPQAQLAWCQRYFVRLGGDLTTGLGTALGSCIGLNTVIAAAQIPLPVQMRATPTVTFSNPASWSLFYNGGSSVACASFTGTAASPRNIFTQPNASSAVIAGGWGLLLYANASNGLLDASAEL